MSLPRERQGKAMECPLCGYSLGPFETQCSRCERLSKTGELPPKTEPTPAISTFPCVSCGAPIPKGVPACPNCGLDYLGDQDKGAASTERTKEISFTCPVCKNEQTTRVSSIAKTGQWQQAGSKAGSAGYGPGVPPTMPNNIAPLARLL